MGRTTYEIAASPLKSQSCTIITKTCTDHTPTIEPYSHPESMSAGSGESTIEEATEERRGACPKLELR
jgi:hypothetical protein